MSCYARHAPMYMLPRMLNTVWAMCMCIDCVECTGQQGTQDRKLQYRVTSWSYWLALIDNRVTVTVQVHFQYFDEMPRCFAFAPTTFAGPAVKGG